MRLGLLFALFLSFSYYTSKGQTTINSTHMPQAGDTLRYSIAVIDTAVLLSIPDTGSNRIWNFDSLVPIRQGISEYLNSNQTPYSVSGKIAEKIADTISLSGFSLYDVYDYYTNSTNAFQIDQRSFTIPTGIPIVPLAPFSPNYIDPDEVYSFPLDYLDRDSTTFDFTFVNAFPPAYYSTTGYRINEVEAWGTVTTPYGSFSCLKVRTDVVAYDTVSFGTLAIGDSIITREYKWISPQLKIPALTVSGSVINGIFLPTNIQYRDSVRNLPGLLAPLALFNADTTVANVGDTVEFNNFTLSLFPVFSNWDISPGTFNYVNGTNSTSAEPAVVFNDTGRYDVQLIVNNGQGMDTLLRQDYIRVNQAVSVKEIYKQLIDIQLSPNPVESKSVLTLSSAIKVEQIILYDLQMRKIKEWNQLNKGQNELRFGDQTHSGTYFLLIQTEYGDLSKKLIIH